MVGMMASGSASDEVTTGPVSGAECHDTGPDGDARRPSARRRSSHAVRSGRMDPTDPHPSPSGRAPAVSDAFAGETVEALDEATRAITEVLDLESVLRLIVERVRALVDARYAALGIADASGRLERFITVGLSPEERAAIGPLPQGHGLLGVIIREGRSLRIPDIQAHPGSYGFPPHHPPMRSLLGVPITVGGRAIGDLYLTDKVGASEFSLADQRVVELFARHAGIAIENARLHDRLGALRVVAERERIGRDLHDGVIQGLYAIGLSLEEVDQLIVEQPDEAAARVDRAIDGIHRSIADIREFIMGLRPGLAGADLGLGIAALADQLRMTSTIDVETVIADDAGLSELDAMASGELLQLVREAFSNIARHSRATRATVRVRTTGGTTRIEISDNGVGFDPAGIAPARHHGLINLRERAVAAGGRLEIDTRPGAGTRLVVHLPASLEAPIP
jgi:signal transduction histidine kinase